MTIQLPKQLRGFTDTRTMPADFNTFDIDAVLQAIYFKVLTQGKDRARRINNPTIIEYYLDRLSEHPRFDSDNPVRSRSVLNRLIRTGVIEVRQKGEKPGIGEQIITVNDGTILCFKTGFPWETGVIRRVDDFIYRLMVDELSPVALRSIFVESLGVGVSLNGTYDPDGTYDGFTPTDTLTLLTMAFLDGFESTGVKQPGETGVGRVLPSVESAIARDLARFLQGYSHLLPPNALAYHMKALIGFALMNHTLKLMYALPDLVADHESLPAAMQRGTGDPSPPWVYLDFTNQLGHRSYEMAVACVQRDLAKIESFIAAVLHLRQLGVYLKRIDKASVGRLIEEEFGVLLDGPEEIQAMLALYAMPKYQRRVDAMADLTYEEILEFGKDEKSGSASLANDPEEVAAIAGRTPTSLNQVVNLLTDAQANGASSQIRNWFRTIGAIEKPYGLLRATVDSRGRLQPPWRYQPTNDLLVTLVMIAAIDIPEWDEADPHPQPIRLQDFLAWLERRFSIVVDRPVEPFTGAEYRAAAQDNLRAMLGRLRQMGIFRDLSDDFTVQRLIPPYAETADAADGVGDGRWQRGDR